MKTKLLVVLNGPPDCGKDTIHDLILNEINTPESNLIAQTNSFKNGIIAAVSRFLGISRAEFLDGYYDLTEDRELADRQLAIGLEARLNKRYKRWKDVPIYKVGNEFYSKRTILIHVSEMVFKPLFGEFVFGDIFSRSLETERFDIYVAPDSGFPDELKPSIELLSADKVLVVRISRDGCSFEATDSQDKDSRGYLKPEQFEDGKRPHFFDVHNVEGDTGASLIPILKRIDDLI